LFLLKQKSMLGFSHTLMRINYGHHASLRYGQGPAGLSTLTYRKAANASRVKHLSCFQAVGAVNRT
jgi:hypothetical protein